MHSEPAFYIELAKHYQQLRLAFWIGTAHGAAIATILVWFALR